MDKEARAKALQEEAEQHFITAEGWALAGDWNASNGYLAAACFALFELYNL